LLALEAHYGKESMGTKYPLLKSGLFSTAANSNVRHVFTRAYMQIGVPRGPRTSISRFVDLLIKTALARSP